MSNADENVHVSKGCGEKRRSVSSELDFPALIFTGRLNPLCHVHMYIVYEMDGQIGGQV